MNMFKRLSDSPITPRKKRSCSVGSSPMSRWKSPLGGSSNHTTTTTTASSSSVASPKRRTLSSSLPRLPPLLSPGNNSSSRSVMSGTTTTSLQQRRHMVMQKGKHLYEWEQSDKKVIVRFPFDGSSSDNEDSMFCIITKDFVQLGCRNGPILPPTWYISHDTGGAVNAKKSKWKIQHENKIILITLYKQEVASVWRYAFFDDRVDDIKTLLKRPKRSSSTSTKQQLSSSCSKEGKKKIKKRKSKRRSSKSTSRGRSSSRTRQSSTSTSTAATPPTPVSNGTTRRGLRRSDFLSQSSRSVLSATATTALRHSSSSSLLQQPRQAQTSRDLFQRQSSSSPSSPRSSPRNLRRQELQKELEKFQSDLASKVMTLLPTKQSSTKKQSSVRFTEDADYPKGRGDSSSQQRNVLDQVHHQTRRTTIIPSTPLAHTIRKLEEEWEEEWKQEQQKYKISSRTLSVQEFYRREWKKEEKKAMPPPPPPISKPSSSSRNIMSIDEINQVIQDEISKQQSSPSNLMAAEEEESKVELEVQWPSSSQLDHEEKEEPYQDDPDFLHDLEISFSTWNCLLSA